ncbi:Structural maintenance of chromosomes protein 1A-like [Oopsacas minuta]|uniref:Structural maintenance of chromosomes protein 1A-like n=1 Tax=Oopsacas minuta TaxID=111878 RepID=A0AAV7KGB1_9METZ|nr:Structural maintenance of chromosomes protein 1A-like [Oopsacas minuta]
MPKKKGGTKVAKKKEKKFDPSGFTSGREALLSYKLINRRQQLGALQQEYTESRAAKDDTWKYLEKARLNRQDAFNNFMTEFQKYKERYETEEQCGRDNVLSAIHSNIEFIHRSKAEVKELEERIRDTGREREVLLERVLAGRHFKEVVRKQNEDRIEELRGEFIKMDEEHESTQAELDKASQVMKVTLEEQTRRKIGEQKHVVSDQVLKTAVSADELIVKETKENSWFKREIKWYQDLIVKLQYSCDELKGENMRLVSNINYPHMSTQHNKDIKIVTSPRIKSPKPHTSIPSIPSLPDLGDDRASSLDHNPWPVTLSMLQGIKSI